MENGVVPTFGPRKEAKPGPWLGIGKALEISFQTSVDNLILLVDLGVVRRAILKCRSL